jgi:hypothetical protein
MKTKPLSSIKEPQKCQTCKIVPFSTIYVDDIPESCPFCKQAMDITEKQNVSFDIWYCENCNRPFGKGCVHDEKQGEYHTILFIPKIDIHKTSNEIEVLEFDSIDDLTNTLTTGTCNLCCTCEMNGVMRLCPKTMNDINTGNQCVTNTLLRNTIKELKRV